MASIVVDQPDLRDPSLRDIVHRPSLTDGPVTYHEITETICRVAESRINRVWLISLAISACLAAMFFSLIGYAILRGVGVWGNNNPNYWGFPIINFVFWVGIGHAGTLISAILYLFRQQWRTSINRFAEAMTIFAVVCAAIFPGIHVGRVWLAFWLAPYPSQYLSMWPQFRSPLMWDVFAVGTYASVSLVFWYMGMVPDLATLRDRATGRFARLGYSIFSLGWNGSARHWMRYEKAYQLLAALATPLVLSVHTVVSFDFAVTQLPGWHTTIFPPYFVAGAVFSGFAMVLTLMIPAREIYGLKKLVTIRHLDLMCRILMATGMIVGYGYCMEFFIAWYSQSTYEGGTFLTRAFGPYWFAFFTMFTCNVILPQVFWLKAFRTNPWLMFPVSILVNVGMWFERFVIVVTSLSRDYLPGSWGVFWPTWVDIGMLIGSFGLFMTLFLLFLKYLPIVAMAEVKSAVSHEIEHGHGPAAGHDHHAGDLPPSDAPRGRLSPGVGS